MTWKRTKRLHRVEFRDGAVMPRLTDEQREAVLVELRKLGSEWRGVLHCSPEFIDLDRRPSDVSPPSSAPIHASVFADWGAR